MIFDIALIPGQHIHIVGIGGFGMSAIARVLLQDGYIISGSDRTLNELALSLRALGATLYEGHHSDNIRGAELVLVSSAIPADNPEMQAARRLKIPIMYRREFIAAMLENYQTIAVSGTHGKTTTTAMLTHILQEGGLEPGFIVGGVMKNNRTNAGAGRGEYFVIEADEYDHMFLGLRPAIAILNNVEYDHPDFFRTPGDLVQAFQDFAALLPLEGLLVANADDDVARALAEERRQRLGGTQTYGIENKAADWWATDIKPNALNGVDFKVFQGAGAGVEIGTVRLQLPGRHNVLNALAALVVARHVNVPFELISEALRSYAGTGRRSELMGEAAGVRIINDYAHHPTAIQVTLKAWREQVTDGRVWAVWQPHTYSRTRTLADAFKESFTSADHALITDIYAAREKFTPGLVAKDLARLVQEAGHPDARYSGDLMETAQILANEVKSGDVVIIMSAGDAPRVGAALLDVLRKRS